jgi:probable HAF family extracellular repeat protein
MKHLSASCVCAASLLFVATSVKTMAQDHELSAEVRSSKLRYNIVDMGPVGQPPGGPFMINQNGFTGGSTSAPDGTEHATLWLGRARLDLGVPGLGGPNSFGFGVNSSARVVGAAQTTDPNSEDFCGFTAFGFPPSNTTCLPFIWRYGVMQALPTLGGRNGYANMINDRGDVAGLAETAIQDPGCSVHRFKPVVWKNGEPQVLKTPGELYGVAAYINESGQSVGASGSCAPFDTNSLLNLNEVRAMFWEANGRPHELPNLGGAGGMAGNHACNLNRSGQAVGHSELINNTTFHATFWPSLNKVIDLGTLDGDYASLGLGINDGGTVVGASLDADFNPRAFVWQHNSLIDMNTLLNENVGIYLILAESVNNRGEVIGLGVTSAGEVHGFQAIPVDKDGDFDAGPIPMQRPTLSDPARERLRRELARLHVGKN